MTLVLFSTIIDGISQKEGEPYILILRRQVQPENRKESDLDYPADGAGNRAGEMHRELYLGPEDRVRGAIGAGELPVCADCDRDFAAGDHEPEHPVLVAGECGLCAVG